MNAITSMSTTPLRQVKKVNELLWNENARQQLAQVAAKHMSPERLMRVVANAIRTTPKLQEADPLSMLGALMQCATLGLEPNTVLGHAYLIPFDNKRKEITEVQLIIGYKGFADLARRSGQVVGLHADVVYDDDELWSFEYGSNMHLRHKPGPRNGKITHAYCHVTMKDGQAFVVLPSAEILKIRNKSQGWISAKRFGKTAESPWSTHEDRMFAKTAVRALANRGEMPLSIEFMQAMDVDDVHVDYASYAKNPTAGPVIDADPEDDVSGGEDQQAMIEHSDEAPATFNKQKAREKAHVQVDDAEEVPARRQQAEPARDPKPVAEDKPAAQKPAAQSSDRLRKLADAILRDLDDSGDAEGVRGFYAEQLDEMSVNARDLYDEVMAKMAKMEGVE